MNDLPIEALRARIDAWAATTSFRQRGFAKGMEITSSVSHIVHHIFLESQYEERTTAWVDVPYPGGPVSGPELGAPPDPLTMSVSDVPPHFVDSRARYDVPRTESIHVCPGCGGAGDVRCGSCAGSREVSCGNCRGDGRVKVQNFAEKTHANGRRERRVETRDVACGPCRGRGRVDCAECSATGRVLCHACSGMRRVKRGLILTVNWYTRTDDPQVSPLRAPEDLVKRAQAPTALHEASERLLPVSASQTSPVAAFREASVRIDPAVSATVDALLSAHHTVTAGTRLRCQRLTIRAVPCIWIFYRHRGTDRVVYLVGDELLIAAPDYPASVQRVALATGATIGLLGALGLALHLSNPDSEAPGPSAAGYSVPAAAPQPTPAFEVADTDAGEASPAIPSSADSSVSPGEPTSPVVARVSAAELLPSALSDFEIRRPSALRPPRPEEQSSMTYQATDGARIALTIQRTDEPVSPGRRFTRIRVRNHNALRVADPMFTWVGWRTSEFLFLVWAYAPPGGSVLDGPRLRSALDNIAAWADERLASPGTTSNR